MQLSDSDHYLCDVELDDWLMEVSMISEDLIELTTFNERHHEVKPLICLEEVLHAAEEGVMGFKQYLLFVKCFLKNFVVDNLIFTDCFYRVLFTCAW